MRLIQIGDGEFINSERIVRIQEKPGSERNGNVELEIEYLHGQEVRLVTARVADKLGFEFDGDVVPASPGYFGIEEYYDLSGYFKNPIIGWRVSSEAVLPIFMSDFPGTKSSNPIMCPDGTVVVFEETFENVDSYIAHLIEIRKKCQKKSSSS